MSSFMASLGGLKILWYERPEAGCIKRPVMRETRRPSSIWSSTACFSFCCFLASISSRRWAWGTVLGNPSRMKLLSTRQRRLFTHQAGVLPVLAFFIVLEFALDHGDHDLVTDKATLI